MYKYMYMKKPAFSSSTIKGMCGQHVGEKDSATFFKHLFRHSCTLEVSTHHLGFQTYGIFTTLLMQDSDGYKKIYQPSVRTDLDGPRRIRFMHCRQQQNAYQQSHVAALLIHPSVLHKYC